MFSQGSGHAECDRQQVCRGVMSSLRQQFPSSGHHSLLPSAAGITTRDSQMLPRVAASSSTSFISFAPGCSWSHLLSGCDSCFLPLPVPPLLSHSGQSSPTLSSTPPRYKPATLSAGCPLVLASRVTTLVGHIWWGNYADSDSHASHLTAGLSELSGGPPCSSRAYRQRRR